MRGSVSHFVSRHSSAIALPTCKDHSRERMQATLLGFVIVASLQNCIWRGYACACMHACMCEQGSEHQETTLLVNPRSPSRCRGVRRCCGSGRCGMPRQSPCRSACTAPPSQASPGRMHLGAVQRPSKQRAQQFQSRLERLATQLSQTDLMLITSPDWT